MPGQTGKIAIDMSIRLIWLGDFSAWNIWPVSVDKTLFTAWDVVGPKPEGAVSGFPSLARE